MATAAYKARSPSEMVQAQLRESIAQKHHQITVAGNSLLRKLRSKNRYFAESSKLKARFHSENTPHTVIVNEQKMRVQPVQVMSQGEFEQQSQQLERTYMADAIKLKKSEDWVQSRMQKRHQALKYWAQQHSGQTAKAALAAGHKAKQVALQMGKVAEMANSDATSAAHSTIHAALKAAKDIHAPADWTEQSDSVEPLVLVQVQEDAPWDDPSMSVGDTSDAFTAITGKAGPEAGLASAEENLEKQAKDIILSPDAPPKVEKSTPEEEPAAPLMPPAMMPPTIAEKAPVETITVDAPATQDAPVQQVADMPKPEEVSVDQSDVDMPPVGEEENSFEISEEPPVAKNSNT